MMETEEDKLKKFARKSEIESEIDSKKIKTIIKSSGASEVNDKKMDL